MLTFIQTLERVILIKLKMGKLLVFLLIAALVISGECRYRRRRLRSQLNVDYQPLSVCSTDPMTGWYRNGKCMTDSGDRGTHVVCAVMTDEFLEYTKSRGNDLSTPRSYFPGLNAGDRWCLCALRWREAQKAGKAPLVDMDATNKKALNYVKKSVLESYDASSHN